MTKVLAILCTLFFAACQNASGPSIDEGNSTNADSLTKPLVYKPPYQVATGKVNVPSIPDSIYFCGNLVPLQFQDIRERLDQELVIMANWHSRTLLCLKRAKRLFPEIEKELAKNNVPDDFKYLAVIESGLDNVVSPMGAAGIWQIMKATAKENGLIVTSSIDERYHFAKATKVACKYLKKAYDKLKSWELAAAAYNMGTNGIAKKVKEQRQNNYFKLYLNSETRRYLFRIIAAKILFENADKYGFEMGEDDYYPAYEYITDSLYERKINWIDYAIDYGGDYYTLKLHNPWIRSTSTKFRSKHSFVINWPKELQHINSAN
ncbi:MAG: lytic transglycosylase domain-containing protein [Bacteroidetes bacterium]|nr:lytic transglycosylase domain-containing protein [Bacteroidota bacterium]